MMPRQAKAERVAERLRVPEREPERLAGIGGELRARWREPLEAEAEREFRHPPPTDRQPDVRAEARATARRDRGVLEVERDRELGAAQEREPARIDDRRARVVLAGERRQRKREPIGRLVDVTAIDG